jgi:hypothetical protein
MVAHLRRADARSAKALFQPARGAGAYAAGGVGGSAFARPRQWLLLESALTATSAAEY